MIRSSNTPVISLTWTVRDFLSKIFLSHFIETVKSLYSSLMNCHILVFSGSGPGWLWLPCLLASALCDWKTLGWLNSLRKVWSSFVSKSFWCWVVPPSRHSYKTISTKTVLAQSTHPLAQIARVQVPLIRLKLILTLTLC